MYLSVRNFTLGLATVALTGCASMGGSNTGSSSASATQESKLAMRSSQLLQNQMSLPKKKRIPQDLISDAKCIAVYPKIIKGGFILAGQSGSGLISCRQGGSGWSQAAPAVFSVSGGSIGLQAGAKKLSAIVLFETRESVNKLLKSHLTLGTQIGATAGPVGFDANISSAPAPVVTYVTSKSGLFAGVSLSGTKLSYNQKANSRIYHQTVQGPRSILLNKNQIPASMQSFNQTLQTFVSPNH